jgi:hypothetical protein
MEIIEITNNVAYNYFATISIYMSIPHITVLALVRLIKEATS